MIEYKGPLNKEEVGEFLTYFYELECAKFTSVTISKPVPLTQMVNVSLIAEEGCLLEASMTTGLLNYKGYSRFFRKHTS